MHAPATMRLCNNAALAVFGVLLPGAVLSLAAQQSPATPTPAQAPPLTVDRDPVRSPDAVPATSEPVRKQGEGYVLHTDVEEVVLNATVLDGNRLVPDLKKDNFEVFEDGVRQ